jgi:hypothetical protein
MLAHCAAQFERKYGLVGGIGHPPRRSVRDSPPADLRPLPQLSSRWCAAVDAADGPALMIDLVIIRPILAVERDGAPEGEVIKAPETQSQFRFGVRLIASMMAASSERFDSSRNSRNSAALRRRSGSFPNWPSRSCTVCMVIPERPSYRGCDRSRTAEVVADRR